MSLLLSLIIGVAAFNIVASLVMVVTDKTGGHSGYCALSVWDLATSCECFLFRVLPLGGSVCSSAYLRASCLP